MNTVTGPGHQIDFVAGGDMSFIRLRPIKQHPGIQLEAWNMESALVVSPGCPSAPDWVGAVGSDQLYDLAIASLRMLGYKKWAQALNEAWHNRANATEDDIAIKQFKLEYGPRVSSSRRTK